MLIYFCRSWNGQHGIGRFSREILKRLEKKDLQLVGEKWHSDVCFSPGYKPLLTFKPLVFTIHDLNHLDVPYNSSFLKRLYYKTVIKLGIFKANYILTVSEFSKQRIISWSGCNPAKVVVVGNGVSECFFESGNRVNSASPFFFCVSNRRKHKNEKRLIRAFSQSNLSKKYSLFFTGHETDELRSIVSDLELENHVGFTGSLSEEQLAEWYRGATALVFPSLYEGFGLPIIEAMACGTPVIAAMATSLPEVGGEAALYVDPKNESEISNAMVAIANDDELRENMREKGLMQARKFSWDITAEKVYDVLKKANRT